VNGVGAWSAPVPISPANFASAGASVAAIKQTDTQLDAFAVGNDGVLDVFSVNGVGAWSAPVPISPANFAP